MAGKRWAWARYYNLDGYQGLLETILYGEIYCEHMSIKNFLRMLLGREEK